MDTSMMVPVAISAISAGVLGISAGLLMRVRGVLAKSRGDAIHLAALSDSSAKVAAGLLKDLRSAEGHGERVTSLLKANIRFEERARTAERELLALGPVRAELALANAEVAAVREDHFTAMARLSQVEAELQSALALLDVQTSSARALAA